MNDTVENPLDQKSKNLGSFSSLLHADDQTYPLWISFSPAVEN